MSAGKTYELLFNRAVAAYEDYGIRPVPATRASATAAVLADLYGPPTLVEVGREAWAELYAGPPGGTLCLFGAPVKLNPALPPHEFRWYRPPAVTGELKTL